MIQIWPPDGLLSFALNIGACQSRLRTQRVIEFGPDQGPDRPFLPRRKTTRICTVTDHNSLNSPTNQPNTHGNDAATRWQQVQELLLGDHKRGVQKGFSDLSQQLDQDGRRWLSLIEALQKSHIEVTNALGREVQARRELEAEVKALRQSHVSKKQFASRLRNIADDLLPGGD